MTTAVAKSKLGEARKIRFETMVRSQESCGNFSDILKTLEFSLRTHPGRKKCAAAATYPYFGNPNTLLISSI